MTKTSIMLTAFCIQQATVSRKGAHTFFGLNLAKIEREV